MAQIVWTGRKTVDRDTLNPVYEVTVDGKRVGIRVSSEAEKDFRHERGLPVTAIEHAIEPHVLSLDAPAAASC